MGGCGQGQCSDSSFLPQGQPPHRCKYHCAAICSSHRSPVPGENWHWEGTGALCSPGDAGFRLIGTSALQERDVRVRGMDPS